VKKNVPSVDFCLKCGRNDSDVKIAGHFILFATPVCWMIIFCVQIIHLTDGMYVVNICKYATYCLGLVSVSTEWVYYTCISFLIEVPLKTSCHGGLLWQSRLM